MPDLSGQAQEPRGTRASVHPGEWETTMLLPFCSCCGVHCYYVPTLQNSLHSPERHALRLWHAQRARARCARLVRHSRVPQITPRLLVAVVLASCCAALPFGLHRRARQGSALSLELGRLAAEQYKRAGTWLDSTCRKGTGAACSLPAEAAALAPPRRRKGSVRLLPA